MTHTALLHPVVSIRVDKSIKLTNFAPSSRDVAVA